MTLPTLRASATNRWHNCARFASETWPEGPSSPAAERGRRVHAGIATALGKPGLDTRPSGEEEDSLAAIGIAYARKLQAEYPEATMLVEETFVSGAIQGTVDFALVNGDEAVLVDWKTGQRHAGYFEQCATYGLLLQRAWRGVKTVRVHLVFVGLGAVDVVDLGRDELAEANTKIMEALIAREADAPRAVSGDWCQWCPAKMGCPAFAIEHAKLDTALAPDVSLAQLLRHVDGDNASEAHRFIAYAEEAIEKIEENLKAHARASGNMVNLTTGKTYRMSMNTRTTLVQGTETNDIFRAHGAGLALEETASLPNARKILKNDKGALAALEAALATGEALKTTTYERWETK